MTADTPVTAVLRVAKTKVVLAAVDRELVVRARREAPNPPLGGAPYPALDHHHVWRWLLAVLQEFAETFRVEAIVPTAFGETAALVDDAGPVLPLMRGEAEPPATIRAAFEALAPRPDAVGALTPPNRSSLALQLFWQQKAFPEAFARVRRILPHAAFWGARLTGGAHAAEASSLAAGGQVLELSSCRPSTVARRLGWQLRLPALREPHRLLGRVAPEVVARTDLRPDTRVFVGAADVAVAHGLLLAASLDEAALLLADEHVILVPGTCVPSAERRLILSLDRRQLVEQRLRGGVPSIVAMLAELEHTGPVVVAGTWPHAKALAGAVAPRGQATFVIEDGDLWAPGGALLAQFEQRRPVPRLALERVATDD